MALLALHTAGLYGLPEISGQGNDSQERLAQAVKSSIKYGVLMINKPTATNYLGSHFGLETVE